MAPTTLLLAAVPASPSLSPVSVSTGYASGACELALRTCPARSLTAFAAVTEPMCCVLLSAASRLHSLAGLLVSSLVPEPAASREGPLLFLSPELLLYCASAPMPPGCALVPVSAVVSSRPGFARYPVAVPGPVHCV